MLVASAKGYTAAKAGQDAVRAAESSAASADADAHRASATLVDLAMPAGSGKMDTISLSIAKGVVLLTDLATQSGVAISSLSAGANAGATNIGSMGMPVLMTAGNVLMTTFSMDATFIDYGQMKMFFSKIQDSGWIVNSILITDGKIKASLSLLGTKEAQHGT